MKHFILLSIFFASITAGFAQKNTFYIGGQVGCSSGSTKSDTLVINKRSSWSITPEVGYFISDNWAIGLGISAVSYKYTYVESSYTSFQYGGSIYGRRFFGTSAFRPFLGIQTNYSDGKANFDSIQVFKQSVFSIQGVAGFSYYVTPRIGIFGSVGVLGYSNTRQPMGQSTQVSNSFGFDFNTLGSRFNIGMYFMLGKRTEE